MAESFVFNVADKVLGQLASAAVQEISLAWGVKKELKKLEDTLTTIRAVLLDAEEQQDKSHELKAWLERLHDVCYEADDVLEEFEIAALSQRSSSKKVWHFFSGSSSFAINSKMGHKIKEIRERLDQIAADKAMFHLTERELDRVVVVRDRETHSFLDSSKVFGRDKEKKDIIQLLMSSNGRHGGVQVLAIVGIGGLGKTTVVKMVCQDERVIGRYQLRLWVSVSEDFNLKRLLVKIIKSAVGMSYDELDIEQLQSSLREILENKRYLLVLDDVWNEDMAKWVEFSSLLVDGVGGSMIIVTTRSEIVAKLVRTIPPFILEGLPHENCMSLFKRLAFKEGEELQHSNLMHIGEEIVKKCKGVPLAVRTLASQLFLTTDKHDWLDVRNSDIWKIKQNECDILPALRLSYSRLPSYLRACFAYCSVFPKDARIFSHFLIHQWIAQGLIRPTNQDQELEKIGEQYIRELRLRSFFQDFQVHGWSKSFMIHDLVHDLAMLVAQHEYLTTDFEVKRVSNKIKHVSFCKIGPELPKPLLELRNLHTVYMQSGDLKPTGSFVHTCILRFKCLRMLDLRHSTFEALPSSIASLKHLKLLYLSFNKCIKTLPNSLCKLLYLQTLELYGCVNLEKLPIDFGNLISLWRLSLTTKEKQFWEKGIKRLTSLGFLTIHKCGNVQHLSKWLQYLTALRTLTIDSCENLVSLPQELRHLRALENLYIGDCKNLDLSMDDDQGKNQEVANKKVGNLSSLQYLGLYNLPKFGALPRWLLQDAATTLNRLDIADCENVASILILEQLQSLEVLLIIRCPQLMALPGRINCHDILHIEGCPELIRRCRKGTGEDWDKISHIPKIFLDHIRIAH